MPIFRLSTDLKKSANPICIRERERGTSRIAPMIALTLAGTIVRSRPKDGSRLNEIKAPALAIWECDDRFTPMDVGLRLVWGMANADLLVLRRCGYGAQWAHAERCNPTALSFLACSESRYFGKRINTVVQPAAIRHLKDRNCRDAPAHCVTSASLRPASVTQGVEAAPATINATAT